MEQHDATCQRMERFPGFLTAFVHYFRCLGKKGLMIPRDEGEQVQDRAVHYYSNIPVGFAQLTNN